MISCISLDYILLTPTPTPTPFVQVHNVIDEWREGTQKCVPFTGEKYEGHYKTYLSGLKAWHTYCTTTAFSDAAALYRRALYTSAW